MAATHLRHALAPFQTHLGDPTHEHTLHYEVASHEIPGTDVGKAYATHILLVSFCLCHPKYLVRWFGLALMGPMRQFPESEIESGGRVRTYVPDRCTL
jgi:hypothetical protein